MKYIKKIRTAEGSIFWPGDKNMKYQKLHTKKSENTFFANYLLVTAFETRVTLILFLTLHRPMFPSYRNLYHGTMVDKGLNLTKKYLFIVINYILIKKCL